MSEGQVFFSTTPNITLHLPGVKPVTFKNGRYPQRLKDVCTDAQVNAAIKASPEYNRTIISEEDKIIRDTPDPKVEADLVERAMKVLGDLEGVKPSALTPSLPPAPPLPPPSQPPVEKSQEQELEQSEPIPTLTVVSRMKKIPLVAFAEKYDVDWQESDTVAILRRRVKSWIKLNT